MSDVSIINGYNVKDAVSRGAIYGVTSGALLTGAGSSAVVNAYTPAWQAWVEGTTSGPQAKIKLGNVNYTSNAIPSASSSNSGIVTTANQTFSGRKTMELVNPVIYDGNISTSRYKYIYFNNNSGNNTGAIRYDSGDYINVTSGMFSFLQYSPNSNNNINTTGYYESYNLPTVNTGLSANATYSIITSKDIGWKVESITFTSGFKSGVTCTGVTTSSTIVATCNTSATAYRTRTLSTVLCSTAGSVNMALTTNTSSLTEKIAIMWTK